MKRCPKCQRRKHLEKHHILPRRHFKGEPNATVLLCGDCHRTIELILGIAENGIGKLQRERYIELHTEFLKGDYDARIKQVLEKPPESADTGRQLHCEDGWSFSHPVSQR